MPLGTGTLLAVAGGSASAGSAVTLVADAVTDPATGFGPGTFANLGLTGTLALVIFTIGRTVYARLLADVAEARADAKEARGELRELNAKVMGEYAPTLARASDAIITLVRGGH